MATTLEALEKRVETLEREMASLRQTGENQANAETPAERGARLLRQATANQAASSAAVEKAFAEMGITGEAVGVEKLREMMRDCGVRPEDRAFSQEILAMRDE